MGKTTLFMVAFIGILVLFGCSPVIDGDTANAIAYQFAKERFVPYTRNTNQTISSVFSEVSFSINSTEKAGKDWKIGITVIGRSQNDTKTGIKYVLVDGFSSKVISIDGQKI